MNQKTKEALLARNQRIIQAVKTKADGVSIRFRLMIRD